MGIEEAHMGIHLGDVLMGQFADLQIDQHEAPKQVVVKHQIDVEVLLLETQTLLAGDERETFAKFQEKRLQVFDDRLLDRGFPERGVTRRAVSRFPLPDSRRTASRISNIRKNCRIFRKLVTSNPRPNSVVSRCESASRTASP